MDGVCDRGDEAMLTSLCALLSRIGSYECREYSGGDDPMAGEAYWSTMSVMFRDVEGVIRCLRELAMLDLQRSTELGVWSCRSGRENLELAAVITKA